MSMRRSHEADRITGTHRFRPYSIVTLLVLVGFGTASSIAMGGIDENLTPWAGGFERINAYVFFAWLVVCWP
jgi:hypothetical protein